MRSWASQAPSKHMFAKSGLVVFSLKIRMQHKRLASHAIIVFATIVKFFKSLNRGIGVVDRGLGNYHGIKDTSQCQRRGISGIKICKPEQPGTFSSPDLDKTAFDSFLPAQHSQFCRCFGVNCKIRLRNRCMSQPWSHLFQPWNSHKYIAGREAITRNGAIFVNYWHCNIAAWCMKTATLTLIYWSLRQRCNPLLRNHTSGAVETLGCVKNSRARA